MLKIFCNFCVLYLGKSKLNSDKERCVVRVCIAQTGVKRQFWRFVSFFRFFFVSFCGLILLLLIHISLSVLKFVIGDIMV